MLEPEKSPWVAQFDRLCQIWRRREWRSVSEAMESALCPPQSGLWSASFFEKAPMASKFAQFLADNKIDPRRIAAASNELERLRPEDRAKRLARRKAKKAETKPAEGAEKPGKPRSGRPATGRALAAAPAGKPVSGPTKTR